MIPNDIAINKIPPNEGHRPVNSGKTAEGNAVAMTNDDSTKTVSKHVRVKE